MKFRTEVELPIDVVEISHSDRLMLWGSCFSENIGKLLQESKFRCDLNPFGILYNPLSIARSIMQVIQRKIYLPQDLLYHRGLWLSLLHHGSFSSVSQEDCLSAINSRLQQAADSLPVTDWMIFTWGTSGVYEWDADHAVVGNCHKLPSGLFRHRYLQIDEIVSSYAQLITALRKVNPGMKFLFTVSPIRHAKDGMHTNQLSKSVLLLAASRIVEDCEGCFYFPAYEIMMDELRDYRFYADDMLHPGSQAVSYIWECFKKSYFGTETTHFLHDWLQISKGLSHRPFNPSSTEYREFLSQILLKIDCLKEKFPYLDVQNEINLCQARLKK